MKKYKILLMSDCADGSLKTFIDGIESSCPCYVKSRNSRWGGHNNIIFNILRYIGYFVLPFRCLFMYKDYDFILGWQQFHAIIQAFYLHLLHLKKSGKIVVVNFTYKRKSGVVGTLYHRFMRYTCNSHYIDYFHVPSNKYVERMEKELGIPKEKFIITGFGIDDIFQSKKNEHVNNGSFCLSIGRSNRDFDWLVDVWRQDCLKEKKLIILSDVWHPKDMLPPNVEFHNNVVGAPQYAYFNDAQICITPIADGGICSGDTVLLTGMMFGKPIVVTHPSTLAEMYVRDGENGLVIEKKDVQKAAQRIVELLDNPHECLRLSENARKDFLENYSRQNMGCKIGKVLNGTVLI